MPDLATSYDVSKDGLTYTFHLRTDAKFSDGTPVTASDVAFSLTRSRNYKGGWGFLLTPVKTITAPDAHTVVITLSQKHAPLLADLAMYAYSIIPKKEVIAKGKAFFQHPVGSGPFYVTSYKADSEIDLSRNPHFYGTKPKISKVKYLIVPERQHPGADAAEQEGGHHREPARQPDQARSTARRACTSTCSRPPGWTSSSLTSTTRRSRSWPSGRR